MTTKFFASNCFIQMFPKISNINFQVPRDTFVHNSSKPASDLAGEMSAALSAVAKAFKMHVINSELEEALFGYDENSSFLDFKESF